MKKRKLSKLRLSRETLRHLDGSNLAGVAGGNDYSFPDANCTSEPQFICGPATGLQTECHTAEGCGTSDIPACASEAPACITGNAIECFIGGCTVCC